MRLTKLKYMNEKLQYRVIYLKDAPYVAMANLSSNELKDLDIYIIHFN